MLFKSNRWLTPDFKADVLNKDGLLQIGQVGGLCGGQLASSVLTATDNAAEFYAKKAVEWASHIKQVAQNGIGRLLY